MERRRLFSWLSAIPLLALNLATGQESQKTQKLKIMMKSAWGSDDPTRAAFPFLHSLALAEAGHEVQIFLLGESTYIMRKATVDAMTPVGWPPLHETLEKVAARHIPIFACAACCRARGVISPVAPNPPLSLTSKAALMKAHHEPETCTPHVVPAR